MINDDQIWDIFTAHQEYEALTNDQFGRFPAALSKQPLSIPSVSSYLYKEGFRPEYPGGKKMAVCISHDVDRLFNEKWSAKTMLAQQVKALAKFNFARFNENTHYLKKHLNKDYDLEKTLQINKKHNIRSTFYFLSLSHEEEDFNYTLNETKEAFNRVLESGSEIGLHGSHTAYNNVTKMKAEKQKLEEAAGVSISGYRNHYLRFNIKNTWQYLQNAGFKYDTTFGFSSTVGYRNGLCHPFQPFDLNRNSYYDIFEIPLLMMDEALFRHMTLTEEGAMKVCQKMIKEVKDLHGVFTLLWHNNYMTGMRGSFYNQLLSFLGEQDAWITTADELIRFWDNSGYGGEINKLLEKVKN